MPIETFPYRIERNDEEIELDIKGAYTPMVRGRYHGLPENCYPDEPAEAEILEIEFQGKAWNGALTEEEQEGIIHYILETGGLWGYDGPDEDDYRDPR